MATECNFVAGQTLSMLHTLSLAMPAQSRFFDTQALCSSVKLDATIPLLGIPAKINRVLMLVPRTNSESLAVMSRPGRHGQVKLER
jgi:hypothetical protein